MLKTKNIIIFIIAGIILVLVYFFFIKKGSEPTGLVSIPSNSVVPVDSKVPSTESSVTKDFLNVLLSVKSIKLDDSILSNAAFSTLHDSSITLTPDGKEGRINPFAPIGVENASLPTGPVNNIKPTTGLTPTN